MKVLIQACEDLEIPIEAEVRSVTIQRNASSCTLSHGNFLQDARDYIDEISEEEPLTTEVADNLDLLWKDSGIQAAYEKRASFQLNDSAA